MGRYSLNAEPIRLWVVAPALALIVFFAPFPPWVVDQFYSRDMYPWLQEGFTSLTNLLPLALFDLLVLVTALAVLLRLRRLFNVMRDRGFVDAVWEAFRRVVRFSAIIALLFLWGWGCNYRRLPLETSFPDRTAVQPTLDLLKGAVVDANALAQRLRPIVETGKGLSFAEIAEALPAPMNAALKQLGRVPLSEPGRPKYSMVLTPFFTRASVSGMINPLGLETIVHPNLLPFERPFVLAHEWAHLAGHADEAEASAVGWLACLHGGPTLAYSANLYLIAESLAAMPQEARRTMMTRLDPGVQTDLKAVAARVRRDEDPLVQRTASRVYDEYLKANRVADGTQSYRRALTLILSPPIRDALGTYGAPK
jgi:hypothetical protein